MNVMYCSGKGCQEENRGADKSREGLAIKNRSRIFIRTESKRDVVIAIVEDGDTACLQRKVGTVQRLEV